MCFLDDPAKTERMGATWGIVNNFVFLFTVSVRHAKLVARCC